MQTLPQLRERYGDNFASVLNDGNLIVPWKPLSIERQIEFENLFQSNKYSKAFIEDLIFAECVLDNILVEDIGLLAAGIVTTVVTAILRVSSPPTTLELSMSMDNARFEVNNFYSEAIL